MAILRNIISTGLRKSAGEATFRRVRGRTIVSQKRTKTSETGVRATRLATQGLVMTRQEALFAMTTVLTQVLSLNIAASFDKTQYGSARNRFMADNMSSLSILLGSDVEYNPTTPETEDGIFMHDLSGLIYGFTPLSLPPATMSLVNKCMTDSGFMPLFKAIMGGMYTYGGIEYSGAELLFYSTLWANGGDGVDGRYVAMDMGGVINSRTFESAFPSGSVSGMLQITYMSVSLHHAAANAASNWVQSVLVNGRNLAANKTNPSTELYVGGVRVPGSWNSDGTIFSPTNGASYTNAGTVTVQLRNSGRVLVSQEVVFTSGSSGVGGE